MGYSPGVKKQELNSSCTLIDDDPSVLGQGEEGEDGIVEEFEEIEALIQKALQYVQYLTTKTL